MIRPGVQGREPYIRCKTRVFTLRDTDWRTVPTRANGQPALAAYTRAQDGDGYHLHTLQVFTVTGAGVSRNTVFQDQDVFDSFGLPGKISG